MSRLPPTVWVTAEKLFAQAFGLVIFAIQAPLLGPHVFGLLAAVMVFVGFWEAVPGAAAIDSLISVRELDDAHLTAILILMAVAGVAVGLCVWEGADTLAYAFGDRDLAPIMRGLAALPLIQALAIVPTSAAQRDLRFKSLTLRTIASLIAGGVVGLGLAFAGAGVWALVYQALVQRGVATVMLWATVPMHLGRRPPWRHLRELSVFALPNMLSRSMSWSSGQLPRLILGFCLGPTVLGLFTLATRLNDVVTQVAILPKTQVARVDLRRHADNAAALSEGVARAFSHIGLLAFPLCVGGAAIMVPLIDSWLDPRWHAAIAPCQVLLLMGVPFVTIYVSASLLLAMNRQFWEAVICTVQSVGTVAAVAATAQYGVTAAALAMAGMAVATVPLTVFVMRAQCGVTPRTVFRPQLPPLAASCVMGVAVLFMRAPLEAWVGAGVALPLEILGGSVVYLGLLAAFQPRLAVSVSSLASRLFALDA